MESKVKEFKLSAVSRMSMSALFDNSTTEEPNHIVQYQVGVHTPVEVARWSIKPCDTASFDVNRSEFKLHPGDSLKPMDVGDKVRVAGMAKGRFSEGNERPAMSIYVIERVS